MAEPKDVDLEPTMMGMIQLDSPETIKNFHGAVLRGISIDSPRKDDDEQSSSDPQS